MRKALLFVSLCAVLSVSYVKGFPIGMQPNLWTKGTLPANHYVNISQISTPYGDGMSVNTVGYPGAFELYYDFFAYYGETFIVPPNGGILVSGYFSYNDVTPHLDRKYLAVYLLREDLSGYLVNATQVLNYAQGNEPGVWYYRSLVISGLTPGERCRIAFGRGDLCDMDRRLEASWAAVEIASSRILEVPSDYPSIHQAIAAASAGDVIQVAAGTYPEHLVVNKDDLSVIGEGSGTTVVDAGIESEPAAPAFNVTGKNVLLSGFMIKNSLLAEGIVAYGDGVRIMENDVSNCTIGVKMLCSDSRIVKNSVHCNLEGIWMSSDVENCTFYHNSLFNNTQHVCPQPPSQGVNNWNNGCEGNFWDNLTSIDNNYDGIVDSPYRINANNIDNYPLMCRYLCGDINHDGKVDIGDVARVSGAFGSYPGHPNWNPHADINEDEKIDIQDLARACACFGSHL